jgi:hypothetical protein
VVLAVECPFRLSRTFYAHSSIEMVREGNGEPDSI